MDGHEFTLLEYEKMDIAESDNYCLVEQRFRNGLIELS